MAEEKLQYTLELATRATGDGAKRTAADMGRVAAETERARAASAGLMSAAEREKAEVERLVRAARDLAAAKRQASEETDKLAGFMRWTGDETRVSFGEFYDLDAQFRKTTRSTESFTNGVTKMNGPVRNNAQALLMFSQGFEDAQYGIRGVLNNIPGLVMALGGGAGLAGGISIAAVALSQIIPMLKGTAEEAKFTAEKIKEITDAAGDDESDRLGEISTAIETAAEQAKAVKQNWDETAKAENSYASQALDNAGKVQEAQKLIAEALGLQVDRFRELEEIAAREQQKREQAAKAAIETEKRRLDAARDAAEVAGDLLKARENEALNAEARRRSLQGELDLLRAQKETLEKIKEGRFYHATDSLAPGMEDFQKYIDSQLKVPGTYKGFVGSVSREAGRRLDDPVFQASLTAAERRIAAAENKIDELTRNGGIITRAETALTAAQTKLKDIEQAVTTNIEGIQDTLAADNLLARGQQLVKSGEVLASELQGMLGGLETSNARGDAAKDAIAQAAEDGRITANESAALATNLRTLIGQVQTGQATVDGGVLRLITLQNEFTNMGRRWNERIDALEGQVKALNERR